MEFSGNTVLITGAAVGIGRACALQFAKDDANIILVDYNAEALAKTEQEIKNITSNVLSLVCDVSDNDSVTDAVKKAMALLKNGDMKMTEIAGFSGFSNIRSFNRTFKKHFGKSPVEYRQQIAENK